MATFACVCVRALNTARRFHGVITRREANRLLKGTDAGTFIVRFSEAQHGYSISHR